MSFTVDTAFVKQYHDTIERLLQQRGSRFRGTIRTETQMGEEQFWEQVGAVEALEITERHGDSPLVNTPHDRRRVTLRAYDVGDMIDNVDKVQMLIDPTSTYVQNFVDALNRKLDDTVMTAFYASAATGKTGSTSVTFPAANKVSEDFGTANSGLTIAKLVESRRLLESFENDDSEPWYIAVNAAAKADLLNTTQVTSSDFNTVRALVRGEIDTFLGFKFINFQRLTQGAGVGGATTCDLIPVWTKSGMLLAMGKDVTTYVDRRADKRFDWYAYACAMFGSTRMQENKVIQIQRFVA